MKTFKQLLSIILLLFFLHSYSQEFSFEMVFTDAIGNSDTLLMGYDTDATDSVDSSFGETNIINTTLDSVFDVRITDEWESRAWYAKDTGNYHLKKQIVKANCDEWTTPMSIDIKCSHWPVTAKWENQLFNDSCRNGSVFTSLSPGTWWDVASPSNLYHIQLLLANEVTFTPNVEEGIHLEYYAYINPDQDTISVFWLAMGSHLSIFGSGVGLKEKPLVKDVLLYPNPVHDYLHFATAESLLEAKVISLSGKEHVVEIQNNTIDVSKLDKGIYLLKIKTRSGKLIVRKIIKI